MPIMPNIMDYNHFKLYLPGKAGVIPIFWTEKDNLCYFLYHNRFDHHTRFKKENFDLCKNFKFIELNSDRESYSQFIPFSESAEVNMILFASGVEYKIKDERKIGYYQLFKSRQDSNFSISDALEENFNEIRKYRLLKLNLSNGKKSIRLVPKEDKDTYEKCSLEKCEEYIQENDSYSYISNTSLKSFLKKNGIKIEDDTKTLKNLEEDWIDKLEEELEDHFLNKKIETIGIINIKVKANNLNSILHLSSKDNYKDIKNLKRSVNKNISIRKRVNIMKSVIHNSTTKIMKNLGNVDKISEELKKDLGPTFKKLDKSLKNIEKETETISAEVHKVHMGQQELKDIMEYNSSLLEELSQHQTLPTLIKVYEPEDDKEEELVKEVTNWVQRRLKDFYIFEFKCDNCGETYKFLLLQPSLGGKILMVSLSVLKGMPLPLPISGNVKNAINSLIDVSYDTIKALNISKEKVKFKNKKDIEKSDIEELYENLIGIDPNTPRSLIEVFRFTHWKHVCFDCQSSFESEIEKIKKNLKIEYEVDLNDDQASKDLMDVIIIMNDNIPSKNISYEEYKKEYDKATEKLAEIRDLDDEKGVHNNCKNALDRAFKPEVVEIISSILKKINN